jgi:hypothetical protein
MVSFHDEVASWEHPELKAIAISGFVKFGPRLFA